VNTIINNITIEEPLGVGKNTLHRAVSLRQHGFLVLITMCVCPVVFKYLRY